MEKLKKHSKEMLDEMESSALEITPLRLDAGKYATMRNSAVNNLDKAMETEDKPKNFVLDGIDGSEGGLDLTGISSTDSEEERQGWGSKVQFLLSVVAYAVGLGNVWRFPYLCQQNGGGAFLIPYFVMLFVEGIPLCVLEFGIGQRFRMGSIGVWNKIHPLLGGLGISCAVVSSLVGIYYTGVIAWCFFYLFSSLQTSLPWADCPSTVDLYTNMSIPTEECAASSPTAYFWFRETLDVTQSIDDFGGFQWKLAACLAVSWILIFVCMARGIENSGKIMYFTAGFPYVVLIIFLGRALTLRGAADGLRFLFTPQMEKLKDPTVWFNAATQIFYSLGVTSGSLIAFGSFNPTKNKFTQDAVFVSLTNAFTAIFASVVVFAILGFKATVQLENCACREIRELAPWLKLTSAELTFATDTPEHCTNYYAMLTANPSLFHLPNDTFTNSSCSLPKLMTEAAEGTGLAFIVFTQAIVELPWAPIWSILFFTMLLALGMGSMFGNLAGIQTSIFDLKLFPWLKKQVLSAIICISSFIIGLLFVTKSGLYWIGMFDSFVGTFSLMVIALLEMIAVCWIYGYARFAADVKEMTGQTLSIYWSITLKFLAPAVIIFVLAASIAMRVMKGINYSAYDINTASTHSVDYPVWAQVICVVLIFAGIVPIVFVAIIRKFGLRKLDVDPSMVNTGFSTSTSTATFIRPENSVASFEFEDDVRRKSNDRPHGQYLNIYRPLFHASQ